MQKINIKNGQYLVFILIYIKILSYKSVF